MNAARRRTRSRVSRCALRSRRFLSLVLILSLWHAPVPWVHAHDLRGPDVDQIEQLHRHVGVFHTSEIAAGQSHLELHTHLILPWQRDAGPNHPGSPHTPGSDELDFALPSLNTASSLSAMIVGPVADVLAANLSSSAVVAANWKLVWEASLRASSLGSQFFGTYGSSVSIGDLVSVRLC